MEIARIAPLDLRSSAGESDYRDVLEIGERADVDCLVEYVTHDGETFLLPFMTVLDRAGMQVSAILAYGDLSPLRFGW